MLRMLRPPPLLLVPLLISVVTLPSKVVSKVLSRDETQNKKMKTQRLKFIVQNICCAISNAVLKGDFKVPPVTISSHRSVINQLMFVTVIYSIQSELDGK